MTKKLKALGKHTLTIIKKLKTKTAETKNNTPATPERTFPASPEVFHFHPLAFVNQMRMMFGKVNIKN